MVSKIILVAIILISMIVNIKNSLHMFQQNRYEFKRYTDWLKENKLKNYKFWIMYIIFFILIVWSYILVDFILTLWILVITAVLRLFLQYRKKYIKPLVYTSRVKRQIVVLVIVDLLIAYVVINLDIQVLILIFIGLSFYLNFFTIYIMAFITAPIEKQFRNHYKKIAKKIIDSQPDLIKIGITGSYGKTSSKNVLQQILSEKFYSLMTPASYNTPMGITKTIRGDLSRLHDVFICEMGADHVGDIEELMNLVNPKIGIVTSIGPQHLATFGSLENIINEKMKEIEMLPSDGFGILNLDNEYIRDYSIKNNCKLISVGIDFEDVDYKVNNIVYSSFGSTFDIVNNSEVYHFETVLLGKHNISNILVAVACGRELGVDWDSLIKAVGEVKYIEHRLELKTINGHRFIDNAFNSNPSGANMSLEVLSMMPNKRYIITPGMIDLGIKQKELNYEFGKNMKDKVDIVILVGKNQTKPIYQGLQESEFDMNNVYITDTVFEAFNKVYQLADKEDTILLENDLPDAFNN